MKKKVSIYYLVESGEIKRDIENLMDEFFKSGEANTNKAKRLENALYSLFSIQRFLDAPEECLTDMRDTIEGMKTAQTVPSIVPQNKKPVANY